MIFSENRYRLFRTMLWSSMRVAKPALADAKR